MEDQANRDLIQLKIDMEMKKNQKAMLYRLKYINKMQEKNEFLKEIAKDYNRYYKYIVEEKKKEKANIEKLLIYLDNLIVEGDLSETMLKRAEFQQQNIMQELSRVKNSLDEIVSSVE